MLSFRLRVLLSTLVALALGAILRLWFIHAHSQINGDSLLYGDIAKNWLLHGVYGHSVSDASRHQWIVPTLIRLPGYPAFLAVCFRVFGIENYRAVLYLQAVIDLASCLLIAGFVGRVCSERARMAALWLAVLCPFTANYVALPLTETLSVFCVALGFYVFAALLENPRWFWILALAFAWSYATLLRPDGALLAVVLFAALLVDGRRSMGLVSALRLAMACALLSIVPIAAWTIRNAHTFHVFEPLAPRYATDPGEFAAPGFQRWTKTWMADFASTYEIYWNVPGDHLNLDALPARAFDNPAQYDATRRLCAAYNVDDSLDPLLDAGFAALAAERIRAHPFRYYGVLPVLRLADMWFRPRVEMLDIELRWWQYSKHRAETRFAFAYGALNLAYLIAAVIGFFCWGIFCRPRYRGAMVAFLVLRSLLLLTLEAPEPRYTLECFPVVIAFSAAALARRRCGAGMPTQGSSAPKVAAAALHQHGSQAGCPIP